MTKAHEERNTALENQEADNATEEYRIMWSIMTGREEGCTVSFIAVGLKISPATVYRWIGKIRNRGLDKEFGLGSSVPGPKMEWLQHDVNQFIWDRYRANYSTRKIWLELRKRFKSEVQWEAFRKWMWRSAKPARRTARLRASPHI